SAAISNGAVQEGVSSARFVPVCFSNQLLHSLPNGPFPASLPLFIASFIASCSLPMTLGLLKGINAFPPLLRMIRSEERRVGKEGSDLRARCQTTESKPER